ncbi:hypothetical protein NW762_009106 [Fusarium torreyae]|uniref:Zn(2)-C6 fungal-type domain-containing protein n=1 Tax=Fusarium torreyae TaxID=1237075 RepID=A0A9W8RTX2_9HYPO|nr:hypothetical protein NW762_009106 [Fusarium torreyae]
MEKRKVRMSKPCDGCSLRRVRCNGGSPCTECTKRSLQCTYLRVPRKRGPKGPRTSTSERVVMYQKQIQHVVQNRSEASDDPQPSKSPQSIDQPNLKDRRSPASLDTPFGGSQFAVTTPQLPLSLYIQYLESFRSCLMSVWPIIDVDCLIARLISNNPDDYEGYALAGAVCATVIAQLSLRQLRLSKQHRYISDLNYVAEAFARHAQSLRDQHSYRESESTDSLLTAFFLHIYFANTERIRAGVMYLHEAIAQLSLQKLHRHETFESMADDQRELMLRIFWLAFVTERTFCVQNGFPTCLTPLPVWPSQEYNIPGLGVLDPSFQLLAQLFTLLDDTLLMTNERLPPTSDLQTSDILYRGVAAIAECNVSAVGPTLPEIQRVNVMATWNWIHILWWQYALRHYQMSTNLDDAMLSILRPATVARETVRLFSSVSHVAMQTHGYGLELKIFRIADSLIDLLACNTCRPNALETGGGMLLGARDTLHALENSLLLIGGDEGLLYKKLQLFMAQAKLPIPNVRTLEAGEEDVIEEGATYMR